MFRLEFSISEEDILEQKGSLDYYILGKVFAKGDSLQQTQFLKGMHGCIWENGGTWWPMQCEWICDASNWPQNCFNPKDVAKDLREIADRLESVY